MRTRALACCGLLLAGCSSSPEGVGLAGGPGAGQCGGACVADAAAAPAAEGVSDLTREALYAAIADERRARAFYQAVLDRHGRVMPFANVVRAESMHAGQVASLMVARGLGVPPDTASFPAGDVPDSVAACCEMAAQAEIDNITLYDGLLRRLDDDAVRGVFERLQWMSRERHLPAFRRFAGLSG